MAGDSIDAIVHSDLCHLFVMNRDKIMKTVNDIKDEKALLDLQKEHPTLVSLRQWQQDLIRKLETEDDD